METIIQSSEYVHICTLPTAIEGTVLNIRSLLKDLANLKVNKWQCVIKVTDFSFSTISTMSESHNNFRGLMEKF
jgi:hypothetical protein